MLTETKQRLSSSGRMAKVVAGNAATRRTITDEQNSLGEANDSTFHKVPFRSGRQIPIHIVHTTQQDSSAGSPPPRSFTATGDPAIADHAASISSLAIGLGHDIGNIVLPMLCYLDSLDTLDLPIDARSHVKALRESAMQLKRLSNGLNLVAHDSSDWTGAASQTVLQAWWKEVQPIVRKSLSRRTVLKVDIPDDLPAVQCPPHQLTRVMLNLVTNAAEAIADRGTVHVKARRDDGHVLLSVTDTGRGMSDDVRRRASDPFFTTKKRGLSTGLGLTQVKDIVVAAGGYIAIQSVLGQGTTVTLTLPAVLNGQSRTVLHRRSAAVVMDDIRIASYTRTLLEGAGFDVHYRHVPADSDALMIVQGGGDALQRACDFVRERPGRRAIVLTSNSESQDAPEPGVVVIRQSHRALQRELQHAARDLS